MGDHKRKSGDLKPEAGKNPESAGLTMAQALFGYPRNQPIENREDGLPLFAEGLSGIFSRGDVADLAETFNENQDRLPFWRGQRESAAWNRFLDKLRKPADVSVQANARRPADRRGRDVIPVFMVNDGLYLMTGSAVCSPALTGHKTIFARDDGRFAVINRLRNFDGELFDNLIFVFRDSAVPQGNIQNKVRAVRTERQECVCPRQPTGV